MTRFKKISRRSPVCMIASGNISHVLKHKNLVCSEKRGTPTANKSTDLNLTEVHLPVNIDREKSLRNPIKSNRNQIPFTALRSIWNQTNGRLVPSQPENGKYNPISVRSNKILERTSPCA